MGQALEIRDEVTAAGLRARAARESRNRATLRMLAIANALDEVSRAGAARAAGLDRQALRDAVTRYNAEGIAGLFDRSSTGRPPALTETELALLANRIFRGPDPETDGVSSWTLADLCRWIDDRFDKRLSPQNLRASCGARASRGRSPGPTHPRAGEAAQRASKRGLRAALAGAAAAHPGKRLTVWFQYEMRVGQKGRLYHRWWTRGKRRPACRSSATSGRIVSVPRDPLASAPSRSSCRP